ncbi:hypothetical protein GCM10025759_34780 [Lysobacter panacisoli]|uniref:M23ase beta-sheet core domain-containing protein n=1 Tax=Lysobacter panacisoli TaxID=1255263 RepID=A0ABP9LTH6_9GAMM
MIASLQALAALILLAFAAQAGSAWIPSRDAPRVKVAAARGGPYVPLGSAASTQASIDELDAPDLTVPAQYSLPDAAFDLWSSPLLDRESLPQLLPVTPVRITSGFGRRHDPFGHGDAFHSGIDFAGVVGTPIHASGDGVVMQARYSRDYGNVVMIDHGQGVVTLYAHNSRLEVHPGEAVIAGQEIARMGSTGRSTGPHLHFEVRQYGQRMNPGHWIAGL